MAELTEEDLRARAWRDARKARAAVERERAAALAGDPERRRTLDENWEPILSHGGECYGEENE